MTSNSAWACCRVTPFLESANAVIHVPASSRFYVGKKRVEAKRQIQINLPHFIGLLGCNANNLETAATQLYASPDHSWIAMKSCSPYSIAENNYTSSCSIFRFSKGPTD